MLAGLSNFVRAESDGGKGDGRSYVNSNSNDSLRPRPWVSSGSRRRPWAAEAPRIDIDTNVCFVVSRITIICQSIRHLCENVCGTSGVRQVLSPECCVFGAAPCPAWEARA